MPNKNSQRSALYFYADEYRRNTNKSLSIKDAIEICYDKWKQLDENEKEKYKNMYKKYKNDVKDGKITFSKGQDVRRQNCLGLPMIDTQDRLSQLLDRKHLEIDYLCRRLDLPLDQLIQTEFLIMTYQIFCETSDGIVLPAEVSIARWSLCGRMRDVFTLPMKPTTIPSGYAADVLEAEKVHSIPGFGQASAKLQDYIYGWNAFKRFVQLRESSELYIDSLIFMFEDNIDQGASVLKRLSYESPSCPFVIGPPRKEDLTIGILSIESLFTVLWQASSDVSSRCEIPTSEIKHILNSDLYSYNPGVCCEYHETMENVQCSQNKLKHICFGMDDHLGPKFMRDM